MGTSRAWLKEIRETNYYTQEKIALKIGLTRQHIGLIENGVANPSPEVAKKIAEILNFDWTKFYDTDPDGK